MRADWTASGACGSGSTALPRGEMRRAIGGGAMTNTQQMYEMARGERAVSSGGRQGSFECRAEVRYERRERLRIDEGISLSGLVARLALDHIRYIRMAGQHDVCFHSRELAEGRAVIRRDLRIGVVAHQAVAGYRDTAEEEDVQLSPLVLDHRAPAGAARRMARRQVRGECHVAELDRFPVVHHAIDLDRCKGLGIIVGIAARAAMLQGPRVSRAGQKLRAGVLLDPRQRADV